MVAQAGSLTGNGLFDFILQRLTAYFLILYIGFVVFFLVFTGGSYQQFIALFAHSLFKWMTLLAVVSVAAHAWIGTWIIGTDYIRPLGFGRFATPLRALYHLGCISLNVIYVAWCIHIIWGV